MLQHKQVQLMNFLDIMACLGVTNGQIEHSMNGQSARREQNATVSNRLWQDCNSRKETRHDNDNSDF